MISSSAEPRAWPASRWWAAIAFVFAVQVVLFQFLQDHKPVVSRKASLAPVFRLSHRQPREGFALEDPTLFALPHVQGFSGGAWLQFPPFEFQSSDWTEPARLLSLSVGDLGARFLNYVQTNTAPAFSTIVMRDPKLTMPETIASRPVTIPSSLRMEGDLARRRLLSRFVLPAYTYGDLLTNSVVQLLVDGQGNTVSAVLLPPGSNSSEADAQALKLAKAARFGPGPAISTSVNDPSAGLTVGTMVFQWQTLPPLSTNTSSATP